MLNNNRVKPLDNRTLLPHNDTYDKKYKPKSLLARLNTRTNQLIALCITVLLVLYTTLFNHNSASYYTMPSVDNVPHMLLVVEPSIEYHNACYERIIDLAKALKQNYHVSAIVYPDNINSQLENTLIDQHINIIQYKQLHDVLSMQRIDGTAEISAVFTYLWFWSEPTVTETIIPIVKQLSPTTKNIVLTDDIHYQRQVTENDVIRSELQFLTDKYTKLGTLNTEYEQSLKKRELDIYNSVDHIITVSEYDRDSLKALLSNTDIPVSVAHYGHNLTHITIPTFQQTPKFWHRTGVCFLGTGQSVTNYYSMKWFFDRVFPILYHSPNGPNPYLHSAPYYLIGQLPDNKYEPFYGILSSEERASQRIRVLHDLDTKELTHELQQCRVMISPEQKIDHGINTRIIHAMSVGTPIMTTQIGARSIDLEFDLKVYSFGTTEKDSPESFAALLTRLYSEPSFHEGLVKKGLQAAAVLQAPTRFNQDIQDIVLSMIPHHEFALLQASS